MKVDKNVAQIENKSTLETISQSSLVAQKENDKK